MDFRERVRFGKTSLMLSRIGVASGWGVPAAAVEKAFHEYGINFFWVSPIRRGPMLKALRNLIPRHRDELHIMLALPAFASYFLEGSVRRSLNRLKIEQVDLMVLQDQRKPPPEKFIDRVNRLRESGMARFVGMSSHERPLFGRIARGEVEAPVDFFQIRYNAVHTGAERDIFPYLPNLPQENRPGILTFTATCWRKLLKPKLMPEGERPLTAADCYRFVLSNPNVDVCLTGPSSVAQIDDNLKALDLGPLNEEEMARVRRMGKHIYNKAPKTVME